MGLSGGETERIYPIKEKKKEEISEGGSDQGVVNK